MIEIKDKKTGIITSQSIVDFLAEDGKGTKGKLIMMIGLSEGTIYQTLDKMWRLKGLKKYQWDW